MRPEYPSGLVLGPGIWRSPVRFPAPRRSFRGHFFVNFGMSWDVSGSGLGTFSDGFGMVLKKVSDGVKKNIKHDREYFSCIGLFKNNMFSRSPANNIEILKNVILPYFTVYFYIGAGGMGAAP